MDPFSPLVTLLVTGSTLWSICFGVAFGLAAGLVPGISGRIGLLIALPFAIGHDPFAAAVFLVAMHAVVHTTGSVPAILIGLPTSGSEAATVMDGHPMMKKGRGGIAVGITLAASALGGVTGALALILMVPFARMLVQQFGSAEVAALSAAGLFTIAALSGRSILLGLAVACLGVLTASVGLDNLSGAERYTFGRMELWSGANIAAVVAGFFVLPEMLRAIIAPAGAAQSQAVRLGDVLAGCACTLRHWWLTLRCAMMGIVVGFIPGIGASVVVWLAYGHASATTRPSVPFGQGAAQGIIAPEAANNAKEGGALAPTLLFAVPGTSSMGILLGGFAVIGIEVGPALLRDDAGFIQSMGWTVLLANVIAIPVCLAIAPTLTRVAATHRALVVPFALMAATTAALSVSGSIETLFQIVLFGTLGVTFAHLNWPRAPFVLGFVIGPILESALTRTIMVQGLDALGRPMVLGILALIAFALVFSLARRDRARNAADTPQAHPILMGLLLLAFAGAAAIAAGFPQPAYILPLLAAAVGGFALFALLIPRMGLPRETAALRIDPAVILPFAGYLVMIPMLGPSLAAGLFAGIGLRALRAVRFRFLPVSMAVFGVFSWILAGEPLGMAQPISAFGQRLGLF